MLLPSHSSPLAFALCALAVLSSSASAQPTADLAASEWTLVKRFDASLPPPLSPHASLFAREKPTPHRSHPSRYASSSSAYPASGSKSSGPAAVAAAAKRKVMVYHQASTAALRQKRARVREAEAGAQQQQQRRKIFKREVEVEPEPIADEEEEEEEEEAEEEGDHDDWAWMDDSAEGSSEGDEESVELLFDERDDDAVALSSVSRMEIRMRRTAPLFG
ncbi:hypothetical protein JCM21900_006915 [Sporobolomyces salmonicolor]